MITETNLACEHTAGEGRVNGSANVEALVERSVLLLRTLAMEDVVHALLNHRRMKIVLLSNETGLLKLLRAPLARAPVERHTLVDDPRESANGLKHRDGSIRAMSEDNVEVVRPEAGQRVANALDDAKE